jgi:hypothetical protein
VGSAATAKLEAHKAARGRAQKIVRCVIFSPIYRSRVVVDCEAKRPIL